MIALDYEYVYGSSSLTPLRTKGFAANRISQLEFLELISIRFLHFFQVDVVKLYSFVKVLSCGTVTLVFTRFGWI